MYTMSSLFDVYFGPQAGSSFIWSDDWKRQRSTWSILQCWARGSSLTHTNNINTSGSVLSRPKKPDPANLQPKQLMFTYVNTSPDLGMFHNDTSLTGESSALRKTCSSQSQQSSKSQQFDSLPVWGEAGDDVQHHISADCTKLPPLPQCQHSRGRYGWGFKGKEAFGSLRENSVYFRQMTLRAIKSKGRVWWPPQGPAEIFCGWTWESCRDKQWCSLICRGLKIYTPQCDKWRIMMGSPLSLSMSFKYNWLSPFTGPRILRHLFLVV